MSVFFRFREDVKKLIAILGKIAEEEKITVSDEEITAELESMAKQYEMEVEKIKDLVPAEELKTSLETRKAIKVIVDAAVAVAPKAKEETKE